MKRADVPLNAIPDSRAREVLSRLHAEADRQTPRLFAQLADQLPRLLFGRGMAWDRLGRRFDDKFICVDRSQGVFCYLLARALRARCIVEFGTSFGVSTIYLALAVRENGGGRVIGTEMVAAKAAQARRHLEDAGLLDYVEIREGDARDSLRSIDDPVDMMLCDGFPPTMLPVLQLVAPLIRPGGVVVSDNVGAFWADHSDFLTWLRDPANGFQSATLEMNEGTELSVRVGAA